MYTKNGAVVKSIDMKNKILKEIKKRKEIYKTSPLDMVSAYNREVETEKEYNGRQLLELLQNADDENTDDVQIELDTKNQTLTISNKGLSCTPFSFEGIRSLMISNLSSKTTKKYIGNKGLGFRSIINWSHKITINSNNLDIIFSKDIAESTYDQLIDKEHHKTIVADRNLPEKIKPIPFLSIPHIVDNPQSQWTTSITINYKNEYLEDIKKQINDLKDEILLFLNSIKSLVVIINGEVRQEIKKETLIDKWKIFQKSELLPKHLWDKENEEEYFDLKIALQNNLTNNVKALFSYFPTKIQIDFPFIIHGTFELNSSRNELNNSPKNKYILEKLVDLIIETAKEITHDEVSYKALEMLSYTNPNNILEELEFYQAIDNAIEELEVFPCMDRKYRIMSEVTYVNKLATFVQRTKHNALFQNLLIPHTDDIDLDKYAISRTIKTESLNSLSRAINNIDDRAELIYLFYSAFSTKPKLVFLIDSHNNLIPLDDDVYTPSRLDFTIPDYVKIKFMHQTLFEKLILKFDINSAEKARDLQRKLKEITNIQSYEPAQVLQKIVTTTNKEIEKDGVDRIEIIKKMVQSLYRNYIQMDKTKIPDNTKVQLLSQDNSIADAQDLFLSKTYPSGILTDYLFRDVFSSNNFLADISSYGFNEIDSIEDIEEFFLWLGVNKHTKFHNITQDHSYTNFVFKHIEKPVNYRDNTLRVKKIVHFEEIIDKLSHEKILLWFHMDNDIHKQLDDVNNTDEFRHSKEREHRGYYYHRIYTKPSYILYQILTSEKFSDYLVGNDSLSHLINERSFNFDDEIFKKYNINKSDIESLLLKIGAVDKFQNLSIDAVNRIVKKLPESTPDGKHTQSIYKLCIKHFERNGESLNQDSVSVFTSKEEIKAYYPLKEVYYNGNIKLPKKITASKAILNYPRRQSTKNVINFFGINNLNDLVIEVTQQNIIQDITDEFEVLFNQIKPYILVYRLQGIETDENAKEELRKLKKINIKLCNNVQYKIEDNFFNLEDNDYMKGKDSYLIKVDDHISLDKLRSEFDFQESFADIIGLVFDIQDTKVFRDMIKEDVAYIEKTIRNDVGSDDLIRARELLDISDEYYSFWKTIYNLLGKNYMYEANDNILELIRDDLNFETSLDKIDFRHLNIYESCQYIEQLFSELRLDIEEFNSSQTSYYKIDFMEFHNQNIKQAFESNFVDFRKRLYSWCIESNNEKLFNEKIGIYNHNDTYIDYKAKEIRYKINIDYNKVVQEFIDINFDISTHKIIEVDFMSLYDTNIKDIDIDDLNGDMEYLSLLYFENKIDEIKAYIESKKMVPVEQLTAENPSKPTVPKPIVDSPLLPPNSPKYPSRKSRNPYKHNSAQEGVKKVVGNKSEKDVYVNLVDEYGKDCVVWVSIDDDSLGYDLKYRDSNGIWKYVEVKTLSGKKFFLTKTEKEFAKKNIGKYEIFLVGDKIHRIVNVDFSDESQFTLIENEFIVFYNLGLS